MRLIVFKNWQNMLINNFEIKQICVIFCSNIENVEK